MLGIRKRRNAALGSHEKVYKEDVELKQERSDDA